MDPVLELARKYDLVVIEDAAELCGQTYNGRACGSFGDISIFSFYPNKLITTGEGGMILCDNKEIADKCSKLRNLAFEPSKQRFLHYEMGWNYRMTNMQAALGVAQLENIEKLLAKRHFISSYYYEELSFLEEQGYKLPVKTTRYAENINWVFGLVAPEEQEKEKVIYALKDRNIGNRPFFWCMHEQPVFKDRQLFSNESYPNAEKVARRGFYIPSGLGITEPELQTVCDTFKQFYE
jgi:perosamine synthetase